jgi:hypothetical protein
LKRRKRNQSSARSIRHIRTRGTRIWLHQFDAPDTTWWRLLAALHVGASTALSLFASSIHAQTKKKKSISSVDAFRSFSLAIPSVDRSPPFHAQTPSPSVHTATSPPSYE